MHKRNQRRDEQGSSEVDEDGASGDIAQDFIDLADAIGVAGMMQQNFSSNMKVQMANMEDQITKIKLAIADTGVFNLLIEAVGNIAGSYILDGVFQRDCKVRITREGDQIYEGALASLKRFKDDVKEVKAGFECGLVFDGFDQMQELDIVEAYIMVEVPR